MYSDVGKPVYDHRGVVAVLDLEIDCLPVYKGEREESRESSLEDVLDGHGLGIQLVCPWSSDCSMRPRKMCYITITCDIESRSIGRAMT